MRRLAGVTLAVALGVALTSCGGDAEGDPAPPTVDTVAIDAHVESAEALVQYAKSLGGKPPHQATVRKGLAYFGIDVRGATLQQYVVGGMAACEALNADHPVDYVVEYFAADTQTGSSDAARALVAVGVGAYCPQHLSAVQHLIEEKS